MKQEEKELDETGRKRIRWNRKKKNKMKQEEKELDETERKRIESKERKNKFEERLELWLCT